MGGGKKNWRGGPIFKANLPFWGQFHFLGCRHFLGRLHFWGCLNFWGPLHFLGPHEVICLLPSPLLISLFLIEEQLFRVSNTLRVVSFPDFVWHFGILWRSFRICSEYSATKQIFDLTSFKIGRLSLQLWSSCQSITRTWTVTDSNACATRLYQVTESFNTSDLLFMRA